MISLSLQKSKKHKYKSVSSTERQKIIRMFLENAFSATQIAHLTGHNLSTIKAIHRIYKNEGRINKKEKRDRQIKLKQNVLLIVIDDKTRNMNIVAKQQLEKDLILNNVEYPQEKIQNTINETLLNSARDVLQHLDDIQSKQCFNSIVRQAQIESIEIKDFQQISEIPNNFAQRLKIQPQVQYFLNLFSQKGTPQNQQQLLTSQNFKYQSNTNINELKRIFEFQIKDYFNKSCNDNLE